MDSDILDEIRKTISKLHNENLIDTSIAPNGNYIFHLYNDGEITEQKGSWAYGSRTERTLVDKIHNLNLDYKMFPKNKNVGNTIYGFLICNYNDAITIRKMMEKIII
jgi:hypothetical protein